MKKTIVLLFLISHFLCAQNTNFTNEQDDFVENFINEIMNKEYNSLEEAVLVLESGLEEVPYHPELVYELLSAKFELNDMKFVFNYCQKLSDEYLSQNQTICEYCIVGFLSNGEIELFKNKNLLVKDENIRNSFDAVYFYYVNQWDEFIDSALKVISIINEEYEEVNSNYRTRLIRKYSNSLFKDLVYHLINTGQLDILVEIIETNQDAIASKEMDFDIFFIVTDLALSNNMLHLSEKLLSNTFENYPSEYKYVSILKAYLASEKGDETSAVVQLERSLLLDDSVYEVYLGRSSALNAYRIYIYILENLNNFSTKESITKDMITFFEGRKELTYQTKLYQSILYASIDVGKAKEILDACKPEIDTKIYETFKVLLQIEYELHKETLDYKFIDNLLSNLEEILSEYNYLMIKYDFQNQVNKQNNAEVFNAKIMIKYLDRLVELSNNEKDKFLLTLQKIRILAITNIKKANKELDKLGLNEADKLEIFGSEIFGITEANSEPKSNTNKAPTKRTEKGIKQYEFLQTLMINSIVNLAIKE